MRLDYYDILPEDMEAYLRNYGWHFSKKMCEWAVSMMKDKKDNDVKMRSKEEVEEVLRRYSIVLKNDKGYDKVFVFHMCQSDYLGGSVPNEQYQAMYVREVLDDRDGYDGIAFTRFLADCSGKGVPIIWEDMI